MRVNIDVIKQYVCIGGREQQQHTLRLPRAQAGQNVLTGRFDDAAQRHVRALRRWRPPPPGRPFA